MLLCERGKVLHFLRVVDVHLGHRRIQDGLASRSDFFVRLYIIDEENDHHLQKKKKKVSRGRRAVGPSIASVYRNNAFRWVSMTGYEV